MVCLLFYGLAIFGRMQTSRNYILSYVKHVQDGWTVTTMAMHVYRCTQEIDSVNEMLIIDFQHILFD